MDKTCACLSEFRHKYATKSQFSFTNKLKTLKELLYPLPLPPFGTMSANITAFPGSACCKALISCLTLPKWKDVISWSMLCRRWQFWSNEVREREISNRIWWSLDFVLANVWPSGNFEVGVSKKRNPRLLLVTMVFSADSWSCLTVLVVALFLVPCREN